MRLTPEEWALIVGALRAYQHNNTYRPLYEKFAAQGAGMMAAETGARLAAQHAQRLAERQELGIVLHVGDEVVHLLRRMTHPAGDPERWHDDSG